MFMMTGKGKLHAHLQAGKERGFGEVPAGHLRLSLQEDYGANPFPHI